ncbi:hypothetical protein [Nostoc sp. DedQUE07]|uniref:hypothetical protein n=1 Tax=Nostoc sp. DedQUE07 TaxID=3075392 RepID=UPI002AD44DE6|nr:hypothetical protein [Nostoc sp. DedQUE07]MDZ8131981.1 hypothetical protein [Nostoc sp. DedQUE07]
MPESVGALLERLKAENVLIDTVNYPRLQFGPRTRRYYFSELLPERNVTRNEYREEEISYKTIMPNSGTRYSPVVIKGGARVGSFLVELGESDIGSEFTGQAFDNLIEKLGQNTVESMQQAEEQIVNFTDRTIGRALAEYREKQRADAIVKAQIVRKGANNYQEIVDIPNPAGHRVTIPSGSVGSPTGWYNDSYDPIEDIIGKINWLKTEKGLIATRCVTSTKLKMRMAMLPKVQAYGGGITIIQGSLTGTGPNGTSSVVDLAFAKNEIPRCDTYDLRFFNGDGSSERFMDENAFVILCETGRDQTIDLGDEEPIPLYNTLGYTAIGRPVGEAKPGVTNRATYKDDKPPRIEMQGWQTILPVIQDPEAIAVLNVPDPS